MYPNREILEQRNSYWYDPNFDENFQNILKNFTNKLREDANSTRNKPNHKDEMTEFNRLVGWSVFLRNQYLVNTLYRETLNESKRKIKLKSQTWN